ncbi:Uncharacterized protein Adt_45001 [Abeliophyllum distichum]|uniref:Uncharacterized protein n=1 Tax=Abeliophyllum distichum TaxID=126358 RepID=A0ABD1PCG2_9LAMI
MASKRTMRERLPPLSSEEEPPFPKNQIDKYLILIGKSVKFALFTFDAPSFHIEEFFISMGWVSITALNEKAYPNLITLQGRACSRVTGKPFQNAAKLSSNQLSLSCKVLHNIIAHIVVPRKGHLDEITLFELFLLDSFLVDPKIDFSYIILNHMNIVHSANRITKFSYGMLLTKNFHHFEVPMSNKISFSQKPTDTINLNTFKRMKIVKEQGQWVVKTKGFDTETLTFEGDEAMDDDDQDEEDVPHLSPTHDIPQSVPSSSSKFTFSEDHYNLFNGQIDSLISTVDSLQHSVDGLTFMLQQVLASQQVLKSRFDMMFRPALPPKN